MSYPARPVGVEDEIYTWGYVRNGTALSGSERDTTRPLTRGRRGVCLPRSADLTADPFEIGAQVHGPRIGPLPSAPTIRTSVESISPHQISPFSTVIISPHLTARCHISPHLVTSHLVTSRHISPHLEEYTTPRLAASRRTVVVSRVTPDLFRIQRIKLEADGNADGAVDNN